MIVRELLTVSHAEGVGLWVTVALYILNLKNKHLFSLAERNNVLSI